MTHGHNLFGLCRSSKCGNEARRFESRLCFRLQASKAPTLFYPLGVAVSIVMSVRADQLGSHWKNVREIDIGDLAKTVEKLKFG
jgi:hypothetical protein